MAASFQQWMTAVHAQELAAQGTAHEAQAQLTAPQPGQGPETLSSPPPSTYVVVGAAVPTTPSDFPQAADGSPSPAGYGPAGPAMDTFRTMRRTAADPYGSHPADNDSGLEGRPPSEL